MIFSLEARTYHFYSDDIEIAEPLYKLAHLGPVLRTHEIIGQFVLSLFSK